jgi:hypothetical protein
MERRECCIWGRRLNERVGIAKKSAWKERRTEELMRGDEMERWKGVERTR